MKLRVLLGAAAALVVLPSLPVGEGYALPRAQKAKPEQQTKQRTVAKGPARKRNVTDLSGFDLLEPGKLEKQTTVVGATRGLPRPVALAPRLGKVYGTNPQFEWSYEGKTQKFAFVLRNDAQQEVFRGDASAMSYRYPENAPALVPGKTYFWTVEASSAILGPAPSAPVGFLVVSPGQREEIEKALAGIGSSDPYEAGLARARIFREYRLWYDAVAAYTDLINRNPKRHELYEQRGTIYGQLEVTKKLVEQDFARAEELQHEANRK